MPSYNVVITKPAQRDLLDIFDYIAFDLREPETASKLLSKVRLKVKSLEVFPERNNIISEPKYAERNVKWCPIENYVIFYQVSEVQTTVNILRVLYNKRNWIYLLTPQ